MENRKEVRSEVADTLIDLVQASTQEDRDEIMQRHAESNATAEPDSMQAHWDRVRRDQPDHPKYTSPPESAWETLRRLDNYRGYREVSECLYAWVTSWTGKSEIIPSAGRIALLSYPEPQALEILAEASRLLARPDRGRYPESWRPYFARKEAKE